jgi:sulfur relay (sulfurtransferase) DsrC/TusE family protein
LTISGKYEGKNIYSNLTRIGIKEEKYLLKCKDWDKRIGIKEEKYLLKCKDWDKRIGIKEEKYLLKCKDWDKRIGNIFIPI